MPRAPRTALAPLIEMLSDPDPSVYQDAVGVLGEIGLLRPEVLIMLQSACEYSDQRVRTTAQEALVMVRRGLMMVTLPSSSEG